VETAAPSPDPAWQDARDYADPLCAPLLDRCVEAGLSAPVPGYELASASAGVIAMCELGWEALRVAVFLDDQDPHDRQAFAGAGWQVFAVNEAASIIEACRAFQANGTQMHAEATE
jgi:hypothetical protein